MIDKNESAKIAEASIKEIDENYYSPEDLARFIMKRIDGERDEEDNLERFTNFQILCGLITILTPLTVGHPWIEEPIRKANFAVLNAHYLARMGIHENNKKVKNASS